MSSQATSRLIRRLAVGMAPCIVGRVSFTGELGYELWCEPDYQARLYDTLLEAGKDLGLRHFGSHSLVENHSHLWLSLTSPEPGGKDGMPTKC